MSLLHHSQKLQDIMIPDAMYMVYIGIIYIYANQLGWWCQRGLSGAAVRTGRPVAVDAMTRIDAMATSYDRRVGPYGTSEGATG